MSDYGRISLQRHAAHAYRSARYAAQRAALADNAEYQHAVEGYAAELQRKAARVWLLTQLRAGN